MRTFPYPLSINSSTELGDWNGGKFLILLRRLPVNKFDKIAEKDWVISGEVCIFAHDAVGSLVTHKPKRPAVSQSGIIACASDCSRKRL